MYNTAIQHFHPSAGAHHHDALLNPVTSSSPRQHLWMSSLPWLGISIRTILFQEYLAPHSSWNYICFHKLLSRKNTITRDLAGNPELAFLHSTNLQVTSLLVWRDWENDIFQQANSEDLLLLISEEKTPLWMFFYTSFKTEFSENRPSTFPRTSTINSLIPFLNHRFY